MCKSFVNVWSDYAEATTFPTNESDWSRNVNKASTKNFGKKN